VNDIVKVGVEGSKVAVTSLADVIVNVHVLVAHAAAALVPAENTPGVLAPGEFAAMRTAAFAGIWNVQVFIPPGEPPLLHTCPVGTTPTAPVFGPTM
jgi:hypothetical protein